MPLSQKGKKMWGSPQGGNLLKAMLQGSPLTAQDQQTLAQLKQGDQQPPTPQAPQQEPQQHGQTMGEELPPQA